MCHNALHAHLHNLKEFQQRFESRAEAACHLPERLRHELSGSFYSDMRSAARPLDRLHQGLSKDAYRLNSLPAAAIRFLQRAAIYDPHVPTLRQLQAAARLSAGHESST